MISTTSRKELAMAPLYPTCLSKEWLLKTAVARQARRLLECSLDKYHVCFNEEPSFEKASALTNVEPISSSTQVPDWLVTVLSCNSAQAACCIPASMHYQLGWELKYTTPGTNAPELHTCILRPNRFWFLLERSLQVTLQSPLGLHFRSSQGIHMPSHVLRWAKWKCTMMMCRK